MNYKTNEIYVIEFKDPYTNKNKQKDSILKSLQQQKK
jgi:hypothetical protein